MSKPDIFHTKNQWNILVIGNYYVHYQNSMLLTSLDTWRTLMHLFLFTNPHRENWFQYVSRVFATAIYFPCIITLKVVTFIHTSCPWSNLYTTLHVQVVTFMPHFMSQDLYIWIYFISIPCPFDGFFKFPVMTLTYLLNSQDLKYTWSNHCEFIT